MSCVIITDKIREFATHFENETPESISNVLGLWWEANPDRAEEMPLVSELGKFITKLRSSEEASQMLEDAIIPLQESSLDTSSFETLPISSLSEQRAVDLVYDPQVRRDRVTYLSRLFSLEVDSALEERKKEIDRMMMEEKLTSARRDGLRNELYSLDRLQIIKTLTPGGIFDRIRESFEKYVEDSDEGRVQAELKKINDSEQALIDEGVIEESDRFSEEEKLEAAKKRAAYNKPEYQKLLDHFRPLAEEASSLLLTTEGIRTDPNYMSVEDANQNDDTPEGDSEVDNQSDDYSKEETHKDGWMTNFKHVSSHESLSQAVRKVIMNIPKLDYEGMVETDDLGNIRYLDADYVHATLIDKLRYMITSEDLIPLLEDLSKLKPWVEQVIEVIEEDDSLFSQFYQDFRKDYIQYWIQKKVNNPDGTHYMETIAINKPEGIYYLIDSWRGNYESGNILNNLSVYTKTGEINRSNAEKALEKLEEFNNKFQNKSTQERLELLGHQDVFNQLIEFLNIVGIDPNPAVLRIALFNIKEAPGIEFTDPIMLLLPQLNIILSGIKKGEVQSKTNEDGYTKRGDLINTFGSAYNSIALMLAEVTEDAIESSVRENDKSYYSHVNPSYLGKLVKQLKNVMNDTEKFDKFIKEEFKDYDWFFKNNEWRNDWIKQLATDSNMRAALQHKVLINADKVAYQDLDELDYTKVLLNEYWAEPKDKMAWYYVPILSDAPSAEFIRFKRYTNNSETDDNGEYMTFQDIILNKMVNIVNQEYDRIMLVRERWKKYQNGGAINPIANFDIKKNSKTGELILGGAEFKFIPELNNYKFDNGETFMERFERLREGSPSEFEQFIIDTLRDIMENSFENAYADWVNIGLLDELPNGKFKNLPSTKFATGQSGANNLTIQALKESASLLGSQFNAEMQALLNDFSKKKAIRDSRANDIFFQIRELLNDKLSKGEITSSDYNNATRNLNIKNNVKDALREYFYNSKFATSQIIQLTTTDLAFYKDIEDFQKRYKEVHAPSLRLNTRAQFHGEPIGRTWERTIYIADDVIVSAAKDDIKAVLDVKVRNNEMSALTRDYILSQFDRVNVADAQAYRSISSYRAMLGMMGQWTDEMQSAYEAIKSGNWSVDHFNIIWQTKKPYVYTQVNNDSDVEGRSGIKTPVQHKNSEFLLLALHEAIAGPLGKSGKLKAINDFMENRQVDVVQFESTTKVGKQGVIDLSKVSSYEDTIKVLEEATGIASGNENPNVVHKVSYEDYGIQTATPEHAIDAVQLIGTQIRKLITADIADDALITVGNGKNQKTMTKSEWLDFYNAVNTENIIQAFKEVDKIFSNPKEVEKALLDEIRGNKRYGIDMIRACTLNEKGQFNIPLYDPVQSQRVQILLNSIIKSRITKQKIRGGALIQVSSYGVTDDLKIVFEGEGDNKRIKYLECYMPAYSKQFYEPLMGEDGVLHIDDWVDSNGKKHKGLPEELRRLIGYRVPTEDKYSMVPLRIKGFLPQQNGSAIMLPAEITTLSGSDYDIDKLYIMLPEFKVNKNYDIKAAWDDFYTNPANADIAGEIERELELGLEDYRSKHPEDADIDIDEYLDFIQSKGVKKYQLSETAQKRFSTWFKARKSNYFIGRSINKIEYDYNKAPQNQSLEARNNAIIDMMWGILTNPDTASKILNPGGFDEQKRAARIVTILDATNESELKDAGYSYKDLLNLPLKELDEIASRFKATLDPLSPRTQVILHQQNMTGAKMIGIYANHNANHALIQHTKLEIDDTNGGFTYLGKKKLSLHDMKNDEGEFISRNNANFLAASVDNVKDNTLHATNQNTFTGDASMLLSRLGYTPSEIALLMRQPIVMEITRKFFRESRDGKYKDTIIEEVIQNAAKFAGMDSNLNYVFVKNNKYESDQLMRDIQLYKNVTDMSKKDSVEFYRRQVSVALLFQRIMKTADALSQVVAATRADTQGGAAGPTIADTMIKIQKVEDLLTNASSDKFPLKNAEIIKDFIECNGNIDTLREKLLESPLPFLQSFYTLGIKQTERMLGRYFPQFTEPFKEVINGKYDKQGNEIFKGLRHMTKSGKLNVKTINSIFNDLLVYIMSKTDFFSAGTTIDGRAVSSEEKRRAFINNFPSDFMKVVNSNEDIAELEFIKRLKVSKSNDKNPVDVLVFKNVGQLSPTLRERYTRDWATLLYMPNPKAQKLALDLFLYSSYRNGFAFGPNTFIHLASTAIRDAVPDYISTLRGLLTSEDDYRLFIDQYIYNHLDNRKLVPEIPDTALTKFTDKEGNVLDDVVLGITQDSTAGDKKAVLSDRIVEDAHIYEFFNYITKRVKGKNIYYRLVSTQDNAAIYTRIEPLGYKNSFIEYEYGKEASEINSVIDRNKKDYDPLADVVASAIDEGLTNEMLESLQDTSDNYSEEVLKSMLMEQAYEETFDAPFPSSENYSDGVFSVLDSAEEIRDDEGNIVCS